MENSSVTGECFCGKAAFEYDGVVNHVINCHCSMCRRMSGSAFTTWVSVSKMTFRLLRSETLKSFSPTKNSVRIFCGECGTHLFTEDSRYPEIIAMPAGVLTNTLHKNIEGHYFVSDKAAWHSICDGLPQFGGESGFEHISA